LLEKLDTEKQLLGFYVSGHPMDMFKEAWNRSVTVNLNSPEKIPTSRSLNLVAMVTTIKEHITQGGKGKRMAFLQLSDFNGEVSAVVLPQTWENYEQKVKVDSIYGFIGQFELRNNELSYRIDTITEPDSLPPAALKEAHISLIKELCTRKALHSIMDSCITYTGPLSLVLHIKDDIIESEEIEGEEKKIAKKEQVVRAGRDFAVAYGPEFISAMKEYQAIDEVWFT